MKVVIQQKLYEYTPDFPAGWHFSADNYFKGPVNIGGYPCFIKLYEKRTNISGWDLLTKLKGKHEPNLVTLYDIVLVEEHSKQLFYAFYEYMKGDTLDYFIARNTSFDLTRLTHDLLNAIGSAKKYNYWIADFSEKNIFREENGKFVLLGLDNFQPSSESPGVDMYGSKDYWFLVASFYRDILEYKGDILRELPGLSCNYLQLIFLILRLKLYYAIPGKQFDFLKNFTDKTLIFDIIAAYFKNIFIKVYDERTNPQNLTDAAEIENLIIQKIINEEVPPQVKSSNLPVIHYFTADPNPVKNGQILMLSWEVSGASVLELHKNNKAYRNIDLNEKSMQMVCKEGPETISFALLASNGSGMCSEYIEIEIKNLNTLASSPMHDNPMHNDLDLIECAVFAPPAVAPGKSIMVQVFTYFYEEKKNAQALAEMFDDNTKPRGATRFSHKIKQGTELNFCLSFQNLKVNEPVQKMIWQGITTSVQFAVNIPRRHPIENIIGTLYIIHEGVPFAQVKFTLKIEPTYNNGNVQSQPSAVKTTWKRYRRAFISYASSDRPEVLKRVQMLSLAGIDFFQDLLNLEPGERWEQKLYEHIDKADVFFLFWSGAAKKSKWVMREVDYALQIQARADSGNPEIIPVIIEGPPPVSPPPALKDLYFNDRFIYFINARIKVTYLGKTQEFLNRIYNSLQNLLRSFRKK